MNTLQVQAGRQGYAVHVAQGELQRVGAHAAACTNACRVLVVVDERVAATHGRVVMDSLGAAGLDVAHVEIEAAEQVKSIETMQSLWAAAQAARLDRGDLVVALGGGLTGDMGGFLAATWMRGIDLIQVPTSLLAMVDASIGGKTGVNQQLPDAVGGGLGKNLIGAFWPPRCVVVDPQALDTLPQAELRNGLAECVKHAMLADAAAMRSLCNTATAIVGGDLTEAAALVVRSAAVKVDIVNEDERETGRRALLNLGHTFAHAIEGLPSLRLAHGQAVAIGLVAAAHVGVARGCFTQDEQDALVALLDTIGLPTALPGPVSAGDLVDRMRFDKKNVGAAMRLIVPHSGGGASICDDVEPNVVLGAWRSIGAG